MKKSLNGKIIPLTDEEIAQVELKNKTWNDQAYEREIDNLRKERNQLLAQTDWMGNSDVTMSSEWKNYRQKLRDITNGLTTVTDIETVTWPTKPE